MMRKLFSFVERTGGVQGVVEPAKEYEFHSEPIHDLEWVDEPKESSAIAYLYFIHRHYDGSHVISRSPRNNKLDFIKILDTKKVKEYL